MSTEIIRFFATLLVLSIVSFDTITSLRLYRLNSDGTTEKILINKDDETIQLPSNHLSVDQIPIVIPVETSPPESIVTNNPPMKKFKNCSVDDDEEETQNEVLTYNLSNQSPITVTDEDYYPSNDEGTPSEAVAGEGETSAPDYEDYEETPAAAGDVRPTGVFPTLRHYVRVPKIIRGLNLLMNIQEELSAFRSGYFLK